MKQHDRLMMIAQADAPDQEEHRFNEGSLFPGVQIFGAIAVYAALIPILAVLGCPGVL
ncbi:MAG: hypothetical protein AAGG07_06530 [Planctomycetota bacterium]